MAITSIAEFQASVPFYSSIMKSTGTVEGASIPHSMWYATGGIPAAGATPTPGLNGEALTSFTGQMDFPSFSTGKCYVGSSALVRSTSGSPFAFALLCDRLWHNSGIVSSTTTAQSITSVAFPARDRNAAVDGEDVLVAIEVRVDTSNGGAITNTTLNYTNSAGTDTRTATISSFPSTARAGTFIPFQLDAGDIGVKSIQGITLGTSYGTGTIHLVAFRVLAILPCSFLGHEASVSDFISLGAVEAFANTVPFLVVLPQASASPLHGDIAYVRG